MGAEAAAGLEVELGLERARGWGRTTGHALAPVPRGARRRAGLFDCGESPGDGAEAGLEGYSVRARALELPSVLAAQDRPLLDRAVSVGGVAPAAMPLRQFRAARDGAAARRPLRLRREPRGDGAE